MKKLACLTLCLLMLLGLCACGSEGDKPQVTATAPAVHNQTEPPQTTQPSAEATEATVEAEQMLFFVPVADEDYPTLLQGGLTKEQLAAFLWFAPSDYSGLALSADAVSSLVNGIVNASEVLPIEVGTNENWQSVCSVEELNRILSVLTDCLISEETHPGQVDGDSYAFYGAGGRGSSVIITSAEHNGVEMRIAYTYKYSGPIPEDDWQEDRIAVLKVNANGLYQITDIGRADVIDLMELMMPDDSPAWKRACAKLLLDAPDMAFSSSNGLRVSQNRTMYYRLVDMNGNGTPELIIQAMSSEEGSNILSFRYSWVGVYTFDGGEPQRLFTNTYYQPGFAWDESTRSLIIHSVDAFNGSATYYALTMENAAVEEAVIFEGKFDSLDGSSEYNAEHGYVSVSSSEIDDFSHLINH